MRTFIRGGRLIDPSQSLDRVADLVIVDGQIEAVQSPDATGPAALDASSDHAIDARDCLVMAGGIDVHTHIGGGKVALARLLLQDLTDGPESEFLPSPTVAAQRYLQMGYTSCFEPAVLPCNARAAHAEMALAHGLDTGGYCLLGNDDLLLQMIGDGVPQVMVNDYVAAMVAATQCIAVKVVNPGGINAFKYNVRDLDVDTPHPRYGVTPSEIIRTLCRAVYEIGLPHPLHVHCSNLGVPGNIASTIKTIEAADGLPIHLTHVQFHCYGDEGPYGMSSAAQQLVRAMQKHPNVTVDVGQIMFGQTVTISGDTAHQFANHRHAKPRKSALVDIECEAGCGVVPFRYRRRQFVHSLQWAIGLELFLMIDDPERVFLTTDHPNGAPFTSYPHLIRLLADHSFRETALAEIHTDAAAASDLSGLDRQYTINELVAMTRVGPSKILGLGDTGTLRPGAPADVVVYPQRSTWDQTFAQAKYVLKSGRCIAGTDVPSTGSGRPQVSTAAESLHRTHRVDLSLDKSAWKSIVRRYPAAGSSSLGRLAISDDEMRTQLGSTLVNHAPRPRQR
ncbi:formylmethanofuran dehydrogenase subunit A [Crateriforma conspicua]|uniref:formylmethanofuran dehydrogenase subunit A n=1 Tax=Crateriforma conspicua TaxID=2527996 RepID=UPI0011890671|nr:formylmethanofuran dehydrogenase subunit A [Crateriforma conspicua]QDV61945.1 Formyltransferase/hydrolase complex Fhc subunit A [Crateriforma conspicua]